MNYTLIAYKPNSEDYCKGHVLAQYSSNFELLISDKADDIIDKWALIMFNDSNLGTNEVPHEVYVLFDGLANSPFPDYSGPNFIDLKNHAQEKANTMIAQKKIDDEKRVAEENARKEEAEKAARQKQYAKLKEEFE